MSQFAAAKKNLKQVYRLNCKMHKINWFKKELETGICMPREIKI